MAIAIEGYSVVARKDRVNMIYPGGVDALIKAAPNSTALADEHLWRCSFMACADAEALLKQLREYGMETCRGPDADAVLVNEFDQSIEPYCEWLNIALWNRGVIAWLAGTTPDTLFASKGWTPENGSGLSFAASKDDPDLEFRRLEGTVEVYFNKRLGKEVYIGRTTRDPDQTFRIASAIITKNIINPGQPPLTGEIAANIRKAVQDLERLVEDIQNSWRLHFCIGVGKHSIGEVDAACRSLCRAFELEKETECVAREYAGICLELGHSEEAVRAAQKAAALQPDSAQTLGNLACAYLIAGKLAEADATIEAALKLETADAINQQLREIIRRVRTGARPQPRNLYELTRSS